MQVQRQPALGLVQESVGLKGPQRRLVPTGLDQAQQRGLAGAVGRPAVQHRVQEDGVADAVGGAALWSGGGPAAAAGGRSSIGEGRGGEGRASKVEAAALAGELERQVGGRATAVLLQPWQKSKPPHETAAPAAGPRQQQQQQRQQQQQQQPAAAAAAATRRHP